VELSPEDSLRLNVLLATKPLAIRIDESDLVVFGLSGQGEIRVALNPLGRPEIYLRKVRELLSGYVLGSPGGYPVYLRRWTRMGQMRDESLAQLLLLGEPEAVVAAACSPGLTNELARRAWWAMEDAENARQMLANPAVVCGSMGPVLAAYLVDYLPFETEPEKMIETVRLVLQPGLIDAAVRSELWQKAARRQAYLVGFLAADPDDLPESAPNRSDAPRYQARLAALAGSGNRFASLLERVLSGRGQVFVQTVQQVLKKPPTQEVVTAILELISSYFRVFRPEGHPDQRIEDLVAEAPVFCQLGCAPEALAQCLAAMPELSAEARAMRVLSGLGYGVLRPALSSATVMGSLMRRKLEPVLQPISAQLAVLVCPR
jgi:hypothetical protein